MARNGATAEQRNQYPPGSVIVPCHDLARYHQFSNDLTLLDVPDGTTIGFYRSASITQNLNVAVAGMAEEAGWAWIVGDDHAFGRDTVMRLLAHDVDIVVPLCARRGPPFSLVAFDEEGDLDELGRRMYHTIQYDDLPEERGLIEVLAAGTAGMLVKRRVFDEIGHPWFENSDGLTTDEDMEFCRKAVAAGFRIMLDTGTMIGHIGIVVAWPNRVGGRWGLTLDFQGQGTNQIFMPGGITDDTPKKGVAVAA